MSAIFTSGKKLTKYPFKHDPGDEKYYTFIWKPPTWNAGSDYLLDSVVRPTTFNGFVYTCVSPGVSDTTEPTWIVGLDKRTTELTNLVWLSSAYNLNLLPGDNISSSTWKADAGITLGSASENDGITQVKVSIDVGTTLTSFTLTNVVEITRQDTKVEILERSIVIGITEL
jgi:hypothetical protein